MSGLYSPVAGATRGSRTQAERRFRAETGRRLGDRLESVSDPVVFEKAGDLIVDCDDGEQLLNSINATPRT